jgi:hypothetical protein
MKKVLCILILLIMVSCSDNKSTKVNNVDSTIIDSTNVIIDTVIVDSIAKCQTDE